MIFGCEFTPHPVPDDRRKYISVFTVQSSEKTTPKNNTFNGLKSSEKPVTKKHVLTHIKKPQKTSIYSRSPRPVSIESLNFYHVLKCAFFRG